MKYIFISTLIIMSCCVIATTSLAQNFKNSAEFYLLKPSDKNVGVKLGVSPEEFKKVFGAPTKVTNEFNEFSEENIQKLFYKSCEIVFTKSSNSNTYRLTRFDLNDATIGFGEKGKYVLKIGDSVIDVQYPENHPMYPRNSHQALSGMNISSWLKKKSNSNAVYIQTDLEYNGNPTDSQLVIDFGGGRLGNSISTIFIEDVR